VVDPTGLTSSQFFLNELSEKFSFQKWFIGSVFSDRSSQLLERGFEVRITPLETPLLLFSTCDASPILFDVLSKGLPSLNGVSAQQIESQNSESRRAISTVLCRIRERLNQSIQNGLKCKEFSATFSIPSWLEMRSMIFNLSLPVDSLISNIILWVEMQSLEEKVKTGSLPDNGKCCAIEWQNFLRNDWESAVH
jgi:hypothetical protein